MRPEDTQGIDDAREKQYVRQTQITPEIDDLIYGSGLIFSERMKLFRLIKAEIEASKSDGK